MSRSSVSRHLVAKTVQQVDTFLSRKLDPTEFPVMMVDGTNMGDHTLVVVLGIDASGRKQVLGMEEGSTESEEVCTSLLRSLIERGLKVEQARLFVIDGGKGIRKSIRTVFAQWALIQRYRVHKMRNVMDHLPENRRASIKAALHGAWSGPTVPEARRRLKRLAAELRASHPGAASSILEGLDETLTRIGLGIDSDLVRILSSTNIIENLQGSLKRVSKNVKRWRHGEMVRRWAATAIIEAQKRFRRIRGHKQISTLIAALDAAVHQNLIDSKRKIA